MTMMALASIERDAIYARKWIEVSFTHNINQMYIEQMMTIA